MSCERIAGNDYVPIRLLFDGAPHAVEDVVIEIKTPDAEGKFEGDFFDLDGTKLEDRLIEGRCVRVGEIDEISYTRQHADGKTTTHYTGRVILLQGTTTVMIRGTFTRETSGSATTLGGGHETEKPT